MPQALQSYAEGRWQDGTGEVVATIPARGPDAAGLAGRLAPWHGRILVPDRTDAGEFTGHGMAMPQMLHRLG